MCEEEIRRCIFYKSAVLFVRHGAAQVTIEEIAFETGVDREMILNLYHSKELLYQEILDNMSIVHGQEKGKAQ